jgi:hypothetical protein
MLITGVNTNPPYSICNEGIKVTKKRGSSSQPKKPKVYGGTYVDSSASDGAPPGSSTPPRERAEECAKIRDQQQEKQFSTPNTMNPNIVDAQIAREFGLGFRVHSFHF